MESMGTGAGKRAIALDEQRVRVESRDAGEFTPEQSKSIYYMTCIASILFPNTIPHVSAAWIDKNTMKTNFIAQKVTHDPLHKRFQDMKIAQDNGADVAAEWSSISADFEELAKRPEYIDFVTAAETAGLSGYEYQPHNFSYDTDGALKFFDLEPAWHQWKRGDQIAYKLNFEPTKLLSAIQSLPQEKINDAINAYRSIVRLAPDELKQSLPNI